jgi:hypothetical protein
MIQKKSDQENIPDINELRRMTIPLDLNNLDMERPVTERSILSELTGGFSSNYKLRSTSSPKLTGPSSRIPSISPRIAKMGEGIMLQVRKISRNTPLASPRKEKSTSPRKDKGKQTSEGRRLSRELSSKSIPKRSSKVSPRPSPRMPDITKPYVHEPIVRSLSLTKRQQKESPSSPRKIDMSKSSTDSDHKLKSSKPSSPITSPRNAKSENSKQRISKISPKTSPKDPDHSTPSFPNPKKPSQQSESLRTSPKDKRRKPLLHPSPTEIPQLTESLPTEGEE